MSLSGQVMAEPDAFSGGRLNMTRAMTSSAVPDSQSPVVVVVSPTPGAEPGSIGGFPGSFAAARSTPIVLRVTDLTNAVTPEGLAEVVVSARFRNYPSVSSVVTELVYRRGDFSSNYSTSSQTLVDGVLELTVRRVGGWPVGTGASGDLVFLCDAIDRAGNLT